MAAAMAAVSLMGVASVWAGGEAVVTAATGGQAISADTAGGAWTTLTGPVITESYARDIGGPELGTIILNAPSGFEFNPDVPVSVLVHTDFKKSINRVSDGGTIPVVVTANSLTLTITEVSRGGAAWPDELTFQNIQVRPLAGFPLASGDITESGSCEFRNLTLSSSTWGFLREVGGTLVGYQITGTGNTTAGTPVTVTIQKIDQFGNPLKDNTTETLTFSGAGTIGTYAPTINGSTDAFNDGIQVTFDNNGSATVTLVDYKAETTTLNVTDGTISSTNVDGGLTITIDPGLANTLVFSSAPATATYGSSFQVTVLTTDQYGNLSQSSLSSNAEVTLSLSSGPGNLVGIVTQNIGTNGGNGTLIFDGLQIDAAGDQDVLTASANGFTAGSVEITVGKALVTPIVSVAGKVYDGTTIASITSRSLSGVVGQDDVNLGQSGIAGYADKLLGTDKVVTITGLSLTGTKAGNYQLSTTTVIATSSITPATLTVKANHYARVYSKPNPTLTGSLEGLQNGDSLMVSYSTEAQVSSPVGVYAIVPALNDPDGRLANYSVSLVNGSLTIEQAATATAVSSSLPIAVEGSSVVFTALVTHQIDGLPAPSGQVQFYANSVALGAPVTLTEGVANFSTTSLAPGTNTVSAAYLGEINSASSTGNLTQLVQKDIQTLRILSILNNRDGTATVTCEGIPGIQYLVQATTELDTPISWTNVSTNYAGFIDGQWTYVDDTMKFVQRFFRAAKP